MFVLSSVLLGAVWVLAGAGLVLAAVLGWRRHTGPAGYALSAALLGVAAVTAAAAMASPDAGLHPAGVLAWLVLVFWALAGGWLARQHSRWLLSRPMPRPTPRQMPWLKPWLVVSALLTLSIAAAAAYLQWVFRPFS